MKKVQIGDQIIVTAGPEKGTVSTVVAIMDNKVIVKGVHTVKKAVKGQGFVEKDAPIDISNISHYDASKKVASRVGIKEEKGKKVRYYKKTGNVVGK